MPMTAPILCSTWMTKTFSSLPTKIAQPLLAGRIPRISTGTTSFFIPVSLGEEREKTSPVSKRHEWRNPTFPPTAPGCSICSLQSHERRAHNSAHEFPGQNPPARRAPCLADRAACRGKETGGDQRLL